MRNRWQTHPNSSARRRSPSYHGLAVSPRHLPDVADVAKAPAGKMLRGDAPVRVQIGQHRRHRAVFGVGQPPDAHQRQPGRPQRHHQLVVRKAIRQRTDRFAIVRNRSVGDGEIQQLPAPATRLFKNVALQGLVVDRQQQQRRRALAMQGECVGHTANLLGKPSWRHHIARFHKPQASESEATGMGGRHSQQVHRSA